MPNNFDASTMYRSDAITYISTHAQTPMEQLRTTSIIALRRQVAELIARGCPLPDGNGPTPEPQPEQPAPVEMPEPIPPATPESPDDILIAKLRAAVQPDIREAVELAKLAIEQSRQKQPAPTEVLVQSPQGEPIKLAGLAHRCEPRLIALTLALRPTHMAVAMVGPAGSGKSAASARLARAIAAAKGLDSLPYYVQSFHEHSASYDLLGYVSPTTGEYHATDFYRAWKYGGVIMLDESDASAAVLLAVNGGLANGIMAFPSHGMVERHPHCYIVAGWNTAGLGATEEYVGRARLDAAARDRFLKLDWPYDEALELAIVGDNFAAIAWAKRVQAIRRGVSAVKSQGHSCDMVVTPRASLAGAAILAADPTVKWAELEEWLIWSGVDADIRARVDRAAKKG